MCGSLSFADSEELMRNSGLPLESLIEVGTEHRLADEESLKAMLGGGGGVKSMRTCRCRMKP